MPNPKSCYYYTCQYDDTSFFAGDTRVFSVPISDCGGGAYIDTTNGSATFELSELDTGTVVYTATNTYVNEQEVINFVMESADTSLPAGRYKYKIVFTDEAGNVITLDCCTVWIKEC